MIIFSDHIKHIENKTMNKISFFVIGALIATSATASFSIDKESKGSNQNKAYHLNLKANELIKEAQFNCSQLIDSQSIGDSKCVNNLNNLSSLISELELIPDQQKSLNTVIREVDLISESVFQRLIQEVSFVSVAKI